MLTREMFAFEILICVRMSGTVIYKMVSDSAESSPFRTNIVLQIILLFLMFVIIYGDSRLPLSFTESKKPK